MTEKMKSITMLLMEKTENRRRESMRKENIEIPDTWIDSFIYPLGVAIGALLAVITYIISL